MLNRKLLCFDLVVISWRERFINPHDCTAHRYTALSKKKKKVSASKEVPWDGRKLLMWVVHLHEDIWICMLVLACRDGHRRVRGRLSLCFCLLLCEGEKDRKRGDKSWCVHMPGQIHVCVPAHVCVFVGVSILVTYLRRGVCPVMARGFNTLHWLQLYGRCCQSRVYSKQINKTDLPTPLTPSAPPTFSDAHAQRWANDRAHYQLLSSPNLHSLFMKHHVSGNFPCLEEGKCVLLGIHSTVGNNSWE